MGLKTPFIHSFDLQCILPFLVINPLSNDKILDWYKLKTFADDKVNVTEKLKFVFWKDRKHCGKRRKCWLPAFSPFPTMFSKGFIIQGR